MSQFTLEASKWQSPCLNPVSPASELLPHCSGPDLGIPLPNSVHQHSLWNPVVLGPKLFEDRKCFVQHYVIFSAQSSAWHNEYLLNESTRTVASYHLLLSSPSKCAPTSYISAFGLVLGNRDACFLDVIMDQHGAFGSQRGVLWSQIFLIGLTLSGRNRKVISTAKERGEQKPNTWNFPQISGSLYTVATRSQHQDPIVVTTAFTL